MSSLPAHKVLKPIAANRCSIHAQSQNDSRGNSNGNGVLKHTTKPLISPKNSPRERTGAQTGQSSSDRTKPHFKGTGKDVKESHDALTPIREFKEEGSEMDSKPPGDYGKSNAAHRNNRQTTVKEVSTAQTLSVSHVVRGVHTKTSLITMKSITIC